MNKFVEIEGFLIAIDSIVKVHPPSKDGKTFIDFVDGTGRRFPGDLVVKLRNLLVGDCAHL